MYRDLCGLRFETEYSPFSLSKVQHNGMDVWARFYDVPH